MKKVLSLGIEISILALSAGLTLITHSVVSTASEKIEYNAGITCKDFLLVSGNKPEELEFLECKKTKTSSFDSLVASYRVSGRNAAQVETFLIQKFQVSKLKFVCCGWEPVFDPEFGGNLLGWGYYTDNFGYSYEITMHSGETLVNERQDWQKIPFFYVKVIALLEAP